MPFNSFIRIATLLALLSVCFTVRKTDKVSLEPYLNGQEATFNPQLQEELFDRSQGRYFSLLQEKATAGTRSQQSGEQLTNAQSTQHTSGTVADELGSFSLQPANDSQTDPLQQLQVAKSNLQTQQSTNSKQSQEQAMIESLADAQSAAAQISQNTSDSGESSASNPDSETVTGANSTSSTSETTQGNQTSTQEEEGEQSGNESAVVSSQQPTAIQVDSSNNTASSDEESESTEYSIGVIVEEDPDLQNLLFGDSDIQDEDEPQAKNREYLTVAFMIGIFALILLIILIRRLTEKSLNEVLLARLNSIMKDTIIIITVLTVTLYLEFMDVFDWHLNVNGICLAFLAFSLSWLALSTVLVLIGQSYSKSWEALEASVPQKDLILVEYREIHKKRASKQQLTRPESKKAEKYKSIIEYVMIRQEFIAPTFLPVISEAFLRDDFNFALYLSHALGGVLGFVFNLSTTSLATAVVNICIWAAITDHLTYIWNTVVVFSVIGVLIAILLVISAKFQNIHGHLVASVDSSVNLPGIFANFIPFKRDPLACAETRSDIPGFLSFEKSSKPYRRIFQDQQLANRQERLFWLGAPNFSIKMVHCIVITHMIWTMIFVADYWVQYNLVGRILLGIASAVLFLMNVFLLTPGLIRKYTIINHIQMKRDFNLIEKVVLHQRKKIRSTLAKFYRLLKSSRKEIVKDSNPVPKLKPFLEKQIADAFKVLNSNGESKIINLQDLKRLVHLCGKEIKRDELVYLAREATNEDYQKIHLDDLIRAVEQLSQDVKLEPFATSREVLKTLAENETHISLKELGKIIADHKVLSKEEISSIIHELKYLSWDGQEVEIDHVAAYIRNNLECMPR